MNDDVDYENIQWSELHHRLIFFITKSLKQNIPELIVVLSECTVSSHFTFEALNPCILIFDEKKKFPRALLERGSLAKCFNRFEQFALDKENIAYKPVFRSIRTQDRGLFAENEECHT